ncbi:MAG: TolC family protein, partial [Myxococcota bacterium]
AVVAIAAGTGPALAQPGADQPAPPQPTPPPAAGATPDTAPASAGADSSASVQTVTLGEVLQVAVRQEPSLAKAAIDVAIADAAVLSAAGIDDWQLQASGSYNIVRSQGVDSSFGFPFNAALDTIQLSADISRSLSTGATINLHADASLRDQDITTELGAGQTSESSTETYENSLRIDVSQPLLRGRGSAMARADNRQAALQRDAADLQYRNSAMTALRGVIDAYWELAYAVRDLEIRKSSLVLANERLRNTRISISAGSVAATEILAVEQTIASREEEVLLAELSISQRSLDLRRLAGLEIGPGAIDLSTSAPLGLSAQPFALDELLARALANSPQLAALLVLEKDAEIEVEVTENGLLPQLDLGLSFGPSGSDTSAGESLKQTVTFDNYSISANLSLTHSLGNRTARGVRDSARSQLFRQKVDIGDVKAQIASSLVLAVKQAQAAERRVVLSQRAIELAEKNIEAEQARFELGRATNFDVLQRQDELKQAQLRKARATVDYLVSVSAIDSITGALLDKYGVTLDR